jgi:serine/threonine protein phosphatase PrpC
VYLRDGNGGLAIARGVGDTMYGEQVVPCTPEILQYPRRPTDLALVAATDGVWDVMSNRDVCALVRQYNKVGNARVAEAIIEESVRRGSGDNITATVLAVPPPSKL